MEIQELNFRVETIDIQSPYDVKWIKSFLEPLGFKYSTERVDSTVALINSKEDLIGTGSYQGSVLKYLAISKDYQSTPAFSQLVSHLFDILLPVHKNVSVYTRPENVVKFKGLGFNLISEAPPLYAALECGFFSIEKYKTYLQSKRIEAKTDKVASIVMNCNPFTNGHKYLIETCASENELVYLFVVEEEKSVFPFDVRWKLIEEGISHLDNVIMIKGDRYIVSGATFPSYFLKSEDDELITKNQIELDLTIFLEHIAPVLGIKRRYVGTEMYCKITGSYNTIMKSMLPKNGVEIVEVERKQLNGQGFITASKVRKAVHDNKLEDIKDFIPETTYNFLNSNQATGIIQKIKQSDKRH